MQVGADMLRNARDGESRAWSNPQTGNSGVITILRSYKRGNLPCRDTKVNSQLKERNISYVLQSVRWPTAVGNSAPSNS